MYDAATRERFWSKVDKSGECWEWTAARCLGYGYFKIAGKQLKAHRVAFEMENGPIVDAGPSRSEITMICHHCDNRACVRPSHLFAGNARANIRDMVNKGRNPNRRGERHPLSSLTDADVIEIRRRGKAGEDRASLSAAFRIDRHNLCKILRGASWRHV